MQAKAEQKFQFDLTDMTYDEAMTIRYALEVLANIDDKGRANTNVEYGSRYQKMAKTMSKDIKEALNESRWRE